MYIYRWPPSNLRQGHNGGRDEVIGQRGAKGCSGSHGNQASVFLNLTSILTHLHCQKLGWWSGVDSELWSVSRVLVHIVDLESQTSAVFLCESEVKAVFTLSINM